MNEYIYVFDCPYHGIEHQVMCFRAYNIIDNIGRWKKLKITEVSMEIEDEEIIKKFLAENK